MATDLATAVVRGRVLVVDDEPTNRDLLLAIFEDIDDLEIEFACSGEEALAQAASFRPDVVLLDIMMPGIDGYEVCRRLRATPQLQHIKVLLVSAKAMPEERVVGYRAGADDYIVKPIDDEELLAKVRVFLRLRFAEEVAEDLRIAKARAEEASKAKDAFLATMSHEVRTPMNGIVGSLDLLRLTTLLPEQIELVQLMHRSAGALLHVINDVLDFAKIDSDRLQLERIPFELNVLLEEVVGLERGAAEAKGLRIELMADEGLPRHVVGDPFRLRQVLLNLVDNAIKFTTQGVVSVRCAPDGADGRVRFEVTDTGIGIAKDAVGRIFEAFIQEDNSTTRRYGGTGLGLAICKRLVELMGGTITVASVAGQGSQFAFTCGLPTATQTKPTTEPAAADCKSRFRAHALVVDDNAANRLLASKMLKHLGCTVATADGGLQALDLLSSRPFDVVFLDCSMPGMDGFETAGRIRARGHAFATMPIIAMTAYAMPADRARCLAAGMSDYVAKPVRVNDLEVVLRRAGLADREG